MNSGNSSNYNKNIAIYYQAQYQVLLYITAVPLFNYAKQVESKSPDYHTSYDWLFIALDSIFSFMLVPHTVLGPYKAFH